MTSESPRERPAPGPMVKSYYDLLGLDRTADLETIKKVFRREIARYHPDKVQHLGPEFQEMASERASTLTAAYKTLTDPELRREYDESLTAVAPPPPAPAPPAPPPAPEFGLPGEPLPGDPREERRFEQDRAGRDAIVRRAVLARVRRTVERLYGDVETPAVKGFDLALVPVARARLLAAAPPRVLVRVSEALDAEGLAAAWSAATRAGVHAARSPVVVLLFAHAMPPRADLQRALEQARRHRPAGAPDELAVIVLGINDWKARLAESGSPAVRKLVEQLHG